MSRSISFDPSRLVDIKLRIARDGDLTIPVFGSDELPFSLVYENFEFFIKRYAGDRLKSLSLTLGSGIVLSGNEIQISVTVAQTEVFSEGEYYYELLQVDENRTWLSGKAVFHNGVFDSAEDDISINLQPHASLNIYLNL